MTRVAYLLKKFPRLSETFILGELLAQEERGTQVHVFSRRPTDDEPRHPALAGLKAEIELVPRARELNPWASLFCASTTEETFDAIRALAGDRRLARHPRFADLVAEALYLLERTRALEIEHVHVHFATEAAVVAMFLHALGGPPYSITAHAKDIYRETVDVELLDLVVGASAFTVTVCDANVRHLEGLLSDAGRARVRRLYNGIDLEHFRFSPAERRPRRILAVGRLVEKKGFNVLVDALALLRERGRDFEAFLVGDGEERAALAEQIAGCRLSDCVELTGALDQEAVRAHMDAATVFCLPCKVGDDGNRDALPTVLLEALANGLPSISTPVSGIPEIFAAGACGVLVPEDDVPALADALETLLDDADLRAEIARRGRTHAEREFDRKRSALVLSGWFGARHAARRKPDRETPDQERPEQKLRVI